MNAIADVLEALAVLTLRLATIQGEVIAAWKAGDQAALDAAQVSIVAMSNAEAPPGGVAAVGVL